MPGSTFSHSLWPWSPISDHTHSVVNLQYSAFFTNKCLLRLKTAYRFRNEASTKWNEFLCTCVCQEERNSPFSVDQGILQLAKTAATWFCPPETDTPPPVSTFLLTCDQILSPQCTVQWWHKSPTLVRVFPSCADRPSQQCSSCVWPKLYNLPKPRKSSSPFYKHFANVVWASSLHFKSFWRGYKN